MSQQHGTGSGPSSSRLHDANSSRYATAPARPTPTRPALATSSASGGSLFDVPDARGPALPPILPPSEPTPPHSEGRTPRSLGVHSILNPSQESGGAPRGHTRSASQMESPSPVERAAATSTDYFSQQGSQGGTDSRRTPSAAAAVSHQRRILSPRSPLYRSQSLGMIRPPTGTINAQATPFLSPGAQEYRSDAPMSSQPPLPTPPAVQRMGFNFPPPSAISTPPIPQSHSRRTSAGISQPQQPPSATASPGGMHPQGGQGSPFGEIGRPSHVPFPSAPSSAQARSPSTQDSERSYGIPVASTGQSNYQLLTLETNQGHVQIPVDVQAASKVADEKRKRNAGASARFRARRKEKEKEASTTIARLEQQVRDANEDVEFNRRERDYLAQLLYQAPGGERHFPRPPSPRSRRMSMQTQGSTGGGSSGHGSTSAGSTPSMAYSTYPPTEQRGDQRVAEPERNVRRRTSSYLPAPHAAPGPPAQPHMGYPQASFAPLAAPQVAPQSHPSSRPLPPGAVPQQLQHAAPSQALYPPPQAPGRVERSWPPQPHPGPRGPPPPPPGPL
ncbi:hypothetical protein IWX90DRAFT_413260 [Phyllosticta citrichinensis]|uniref:BZIP domain-containing protein n=1 Tax=Phyllosticta citrichinensis TaxID=1130410 RepID=A0ABR1Y0F4_9PEZI